MTNLRNFTLQTVLVQRPRYTKDDSGAGRQQFFQVSASEIPCSIQPAGGGTSYFFGERQTTNEFFVYFDTDPGIQRGDRLQDQDGIYYSVTNWENIAGRSQIWVARATQLNASSPLT